MRCRQGAGDFGEHFRLGRCTNEFGNRMEDFTERRSVLAFCVGGGVCFSSPFAGVVPAGAELAERSIHSFVSKTIHRFIPFKTTDFYVFHVRNIYRQIIAWSPNKNRTNFKEIEK